MRSAGDISDPVCGNCRGTGWDSDWLHICMACNGTGEDTAISRAWIEAPKVYIIFNIDTGWRSPQYNTYQEAFAEYSRLMKKANNTIDSLKMQQALKSNVELVVSDDEIRRLRKVLEL